MKVKLAVLTFFLLVLIGILYPPLTTKNRFLDSKRKQDFVKGLILSIKEIKVDGIPYPMNPSFVQDGDGYLMVFRFDSPRGMDWRLLFENTQPYLGIVRLNSSFEQVEPFQKLDTRFDRQGVPSQSVEPRIFIAGDQRYVLFKDIENGDPLGVRQMVLAKLNETNGLFSLDRIRPLKNEQCFDCEQSWMPFVEENQLSIVYSINPHLILRVDPETGRSHIQEQTEADIDWDHGPMLGGTPSIPIDDKTRLAFFHSWEMTTPTFWKRKPMRYYFLGAYTFDRKPPYAVRAVLKGPLLHDHFYQKENSNRVIFPAGVVQRKDRLFLSYGENDSRLMVAEIDLPSLRNEFKPVSSQK